MPKQALLLSLLIILAGCQPVVQQQTLAQQRGAHITEQLNLGRDASARCGRELSERNQFRNLATKIAAGSEITPLQMADRQRPSLADVAAMNEWFEGNKVCRQLALRAAQSAHPAFAAIYLESWPEIDRIYADVVGRQKTWGEIAIQISQYRQRFQARWNTASADINERLNREHREEMVSRAAERERLERQMDRAIFQYQNLQQQQNLSNRQVQTTCHGMGFTIDCTSRFR